MGTFSGNFSGIHVSGAVCIAMFSVLLQCSYLFYAGKTLNFDTTTFNIQCYTIFHMCSLSMNILSMY